MVRQVANSLWWDERNKRWTIKYRGRSYGVSVRQLRGREGDVGNSRSGSESAARRWWEEKRCSIDSERLKKQGIELAISHAVERQQQNNRIGNQADAHFWECFGRNLQRLPQAPNAVDVSFDPDEDRFPGPADPTTSPVVLSALAKLLSMLQADKQNAVAFAERNGISLSVQQDIDSSRSIGELVEAYKASRRADVDRGDLSADQFGLIAILPQTQLKVA
jgi:hypothetical protein